MQDRNSKNVGYPSQFAIFLGLTGGGLIISVILSAVIVLMMAGKIPASEDALLQPQYYNLVMVLQVVTTFFIFFIPTYFYSLICYRKPFIFLGYNFHFNYRQVFIIIAILFLTFPLSGALGELNKILPIPEHWATRFKAWETSRAAQEAALIQINSFSKYIISMVVIAFLPALFEETFFRAGLQNLFTRWFKGPWIAIIVTSIIFSLIHISYYGFLVRFALGFILGLVYYYSGSIWLNILFHFLFNGLQVTALYAFSISKIPGKKDIETNFPMWMGALALILIIYLFMYFIKVSKAEKLKHTEEDNIETDDFTNWNTS